MSNGKKKHAARKMLLNSMAIYLHRYGDTRARFIAYSETGFFSLPFALYRLISIEALIWLVSNAAWMRVNDEILRQFNKWPIYRSITCSFIRIYRRESSWLFRFRNIKFEKRFEQGAKPVSLGGFFVFISSSSAHTVHVNFSWLFASAIKILENVCHMQIRSVR